MRSRGEAQSASERTITFGVQGLGFNLGFRAWGLGGGQNLGFRVQGSGFRVQGSGSSVKLDAGFRAAEGEAHMPRALERTITVLKGFRI